MATRPKKIRELQRKLYLRSKQAPERKFYSLYDKLYRMDMLRTAYAQVRANKGCPGIDGISFEQIEAAPGGAEELLRELQGELREKTYRPARIKRVLIPKGDGRSRPLGIMTIRDRVVQAAIALVMQPIYEPHLHEGSYGYRPKRCAQDAVLEIERHLKQGYRQVLDADLSGYFESIPRDKLLEKIGRRISDHSFLDLLRRTLASPIEEVDEQGRIKILPNKIGVAQGSAASPLLANIYLNDFCLMIHNQTPCKIISYADDFVILHKEPFTQAQHEGIAKRLRSRGAKIKLREDAKR